MKWRRGRHAEGNKYKLIRGVMQHRCGNTIGEQVHTQSWWGGEGRQEPKPVDSSE